MTPENQDAPREMPPDADQMLVAMAVSMAVLREMYGQIRSMASDVFPPSSPMADSARVIVKEIRKIRREIILTLTRDVIYSLSANDCKWDNE